MLVSLQDTGLTRLFSAKNDFPTEWYAFLNPASASADQVLSLNISRDRFPYFASVSQNLKITALELVADTALGSINGIQVTPAPPPGPPLNMINDNYYGPMLRLVLNYSTSKKDSGVWTFTMGHSDPRIAMKYQHPELEQVRNVLNGRLGQELRRA